ncbi:hypothetical protein [Halorarum salinum]|nr:hypothetical protein [Halobaculum salinum]
MSDSLTRSTASPSGDAAGVRPRGTAPNLVPAVRAEPPLDIEPVT